MGKPPQLALVAQGKKTIKIIYCVWVGVSQAYISELQWMKLMSHGYILVNFNGWNLWAVPMLLSFNEWNLKTLSLGGWREGQGREKGGGEGGGYINKKIYGY